jgi:hypothetical protein
MRKRSEQWGNERDSFLKDHVPVWKPNDGENVIRILPPSWEGADHYGLDVYVHYGVGPDNSTYLDLVRMKKGPDPITEEMQRARQEGDEEYAKQLESKKRVLVYLIDRDKPKEGPMMWAMPWTVDKEIAIHSWDSRTQEALPVDSPEDGFDIIINRQGKGARTEYTVKISRNPSPLQMTPEITDLLDNHPLPECLNFYSYEQIQKAFLGGSKKSTTAKTSDYEERPASKPKKRGIDLKSLTWDSVHELKGAELSALIEAMAEELGIDFDGDQYEMDSELADDLCKELGLEPPPRASRRRAGPEPETRTVKRRAEPDDDESDPEVDEEDEPKPEPAKPSKVSSYREKLAGIGKRV